MPSRSVRRRRHKRLQRVLALPPQEFGAEATRLLQEWRRVAFSRASKLNSPLVWELAEDATNRQICRHLDSTGELYADLRAVCTVAAAAMAK